MTTKLKLYNTALRHIGELPLSSLSEARSPRRVLDSAYDDGFVDKILEMGNWKFAARTVRLEIDTDVTPSFGYRNAFAKPDDFVHVTMVCSDEYMKTPLLEYSDEGDYWFSDLDEIYVQYVSNGVEWGNDLTRWPESFNSFAGYALADLVVERITQNDSKKKGIKAELKMALNEARAKDAIKGPTKFLPPGQWTQSRSQRSNRRDVGSRGRLIG